MTFNAGPKPREAGGDGGRCRRLASQGRSGLVARFESGLKVVYKPTSLALDLHFQEFLTWLNGCGVDASFRTICILERGD